MPTKIKHVRGVSINEVLSKKLNFYLGISLGNKWFSKEHIKEYLLWALKYTNERVCILIADSIHAINIEIRNKRGCASALKCALKQGEKMKNLVNQTIIELPKKERDRIDVIRWDDLAKDKEYAETRKTIHDEFNSNQEFREAVLNITRHHLTTEKRTFSEEEIALLSRYILEEMPMSLNGFLYKNIRYNAWIYPVDGLLGELVEEIQKKKRFKDLHKKTVIKTNGLIILEVIDRIV